MTNSHHQHNEHTCNIEKINTIMKHFFLNLEDSLQ